MRSFHPQTWLPADLGPEKSRWLVPPVLAVLLAVPGFSYTYLFDDFDFLGRGLTPRLRHLLPDPVSLFYRPISRDLYFGLLAQASPVSPFLGHLANAAFLGIAVVLLQRVFQRLLDSRGAFVGATCFALFGQLPLLVGWVSGAQDLLAILWLALALDLELRGRSKVAIIAAAASVLSKETAVACLPALALARTIAGSNRPRLLLSGLRYCTLAAAWALVHPGLHTLLSRGLTGGGTGYVGIDNPGRWNFLLRSCAVSLNLPVPGFTCPWPTGLSWLAALIVAGSLFARPSLFGRDSKGLAAVSHSAGRAALLGSLVALPPVVLTSVLVKHWAPYYTCLPAVGIALVLGASLSKAHPVLLRGFLCGFALLGIWSRGMEIDPEVPTERNLRPASSALQSLEPQLKRLAPRLPSSSHVYMSVLTRGAVSVHAHMYRFQTPRIWYRDPTLQVLRPEAYTRREGASFLFWISPELTVYEVDLSTFLPRSVGAPADYSQYQKVMRAYARGLGGAGDLERAVHILLGMPEKTAGSWVMDRRLAAMLLLQNGKEESAVKLLSELPDLPKDDAARVVAALLSTSAGNDGEDDAALRAFGFSVADPAAIRSVLRVALDIGGDRAARRLALRLLRMLPRDPEGQSALRTLAMRERSDRIVTPAFEAVPPN